MILILHGDNVSRSREIMKQFQDRKDVERKKEFLLKDISPEKLSILCNTFDFFGNAPFIVLDITGIKSDEIKPYIEIFEKTPSETVLILFSSSKINSRHALLKTTTIKAKVELSEITIPHNIFKYLDFVYKKDRKGAYRELQKLKSGQEDDFKLFSMLLYGFRNIVSYTLASPSFAKLTPFVKGNVKKQAAFYTETEVLNLLESLYNIDKQVKTGQLSSELMVPVAMEKIFNVPAKNLSKR